MRRNLFRLSDDEWGRIEAHPPEGRRGARRVDDRRVISGVIHMLKTGARWRDRLSEYGPYTTICNRFNRRSRQDVFHALTASSGVIGAASADSTHIKAHRSAAGAKGGLCQRRRPIARRTDDQGSRTVGQTRQACCAHPHARAEPRPRRPRRAPPPGPDAERAHRRPRLRRAQAPGPARPTPM